MSIIDNLPKGDLSDLDDISYEDLFHGYGEWEIQIGDSTNIGGIIAGDPIFINPSEDNNVPQDSSGECSAPDSPIIDITDEMKAFLEQYVEKVHKNLPDIFY